MHQDNPGISLHLPEILMISASLSVVFSADSARAGNAAEDMLKVPNASIDITVAKPFAFKVLASARKFPAAPFTTISNLPNIFNAYSTAALQAFGSRTSQTFHLHILPVSRCKMDAERSRNFYRLPHITAPFAPCINNCLVTSKQIPEPPPVTKAIFPAIQSDLKGEVMLVVHVCRQTLIAFLGVTLRGLTNKDFQLSCREESGR